MANVVTRIADRAATLLSVLIVLAYFLYFTVPSLSSSVSFGRGETQSDVGGMTSQPGTETVLAASVVALIALFGWSRATRPTSPIRWRELWWMVLPIVMIVLLLSSSSPWALTRPRAPFPTPRRSSPFSRQSPASGCSGNCCFAAFSSRASKRCPGPSPHLSCYPSPSVSCTMSTGSRDSHWMTPPCRFFMR